MEEKIIQDNAPDENTDKKKKGLSFKKKVIIIIASLLVVLAACGVILTLIQSNGEDDGGQKVYPPIDEALLSDTKPEGFDIMEYDEYTEKHDISIYYDKNNIKESVSPNIAHNYGEAFAVVYNVITAIREGDAERYNTYMGKKEFKKESFTQQQIYQITIKFVSVSSDDEEVPYDKVIFDVEYKIHENNGTYRNNIESDASRPIYFIVDNSSGEMLVTDMIEHED